MSESFVDDLREKSGEVDLDSILTSSLGGYTKRSVLEYLSVIKKQQQSLRETCDEEIRRLQAEKEEIVADKEKALSGLPALTERADQAEQRAALTAEELARLREEYDLLEKDMEEALVRISEDEVTIRRYGQELEDEKLRAEQARQNTSSAHVLLETANARNEELSAELGRLTAEMEDLKKNFRDYVALHSDEKMEELKSTISEQMVTIEILNKEVAIRDEELDNRALRLNTLTRQEQENRCEMERLQSAVARALEQNEWMEAENEELGQRLAEQMDSYLSMSRENARLRASADTFRRRLESEQAKSSIASISIEATA